MHIITPSETENAVLAELGDNFTAPGHNRHSSMMAEERQFLNALVLRKRPVKILEVGVNSGGSAAIILNATKTVPGSVLHSIDISDHCDSEPERKIGEVVDAYPELKKRHRLYTGSIAASFMDAIGGDIDFCFIDTAHVLPGEILDFLMVFPYLRPGCTLVFHDTQLHTNYGFDGVATNCLLLSAIDGERLVPAAPDAAAFAAEREALRGDVHSPYFPFPNIGGIVPAADLQENIIGVFQLLTLRWAYQPSPEHVELMRKHFARFYDRYAVEFFEKVLIHKRAGQAAEDAAGAVAARCGQV